MLWFKKISIFYIIIPLFISQILIMGKPDYPILDEHHFVNFTRWLQLGYDHSPYQLPGLSLIGLPFMEILGDNAISWRLPIIIFGSVFVYFYYKVVKKLSNHKIAITSSVLLSLSPMIFAHSGLMLRDIPVLALGFIGIYLYLNKRYYFAFFVIGISALIKETVIFFIFFIVMYHISKNYKSIVYLLLQNRKKLLGKTLKPAACGVILVLSFLIPLYIYDSTVNVYEYSTKYREAIHYDNGIETSRIFIILDHPQKVLFENHRFNYLDTVKDPLHHIELLFTKGYYDQNNDQSSSIITGLYDSNEIVSIFESVTDDPDYEILRIQSTFEYWWMFGFWGILVMMGISVYRKTKYNTTIQYHYKIYCMACLSFFVPVVLVAFFRDTYAYYMLYFMPFMMFSVVSLILSIQRKYVKVAVLAVLAGVMLYQFVYVFPVWPKF